MGPSVQITFDAADPGRLARFWCGVPGYQIQDPPEGSDSREGWLRKRGIPEERWGDACPIVDPQGNEFCLQ